MNILLTGGTGFIGDTLVRFLLDEGHQVRILTRENEVAPPFYTWNSTEINEKAFEDLDGIIHLAGAPLMKRWTKKYKEEIISSRVDSANLLFNEVKRLKIPLKFFISAAGSSYYGQKTSDQIFEESDEVGSDFLAEVCKLWEQAAFQFEEIGARVVCVRTPLVLAQHASAFQLMKRPTKYGLGACLGSGKQWTTWIHLDDLCRIYVEAITNPNFFGAINVVSSDQMTHQDFMNQLAKALGTQIYMPSIPSPLVKLGMGEKACLILEGARLSNQKLKQTGFQFQYNQLDDFFQTL